MVAPKKATIMLQDKIEFISNYAILIPIAIGLFYISKIQGYTRTFLFFLIYGFLSDTFDYYYQDQFIKNVVFAIYTLIEVLFCLLFLRNISINPLERKAINFVVLLTFFFWLICNLILTQLKRSTHVHSVLFDIVSSLLISIISSYTVVNIAERQDNLIANSSFWFSISIFFYFFCSIFIFNFIHEDFINKIWWIHNIINILTYLIYTKAFLVAGKTQKEKTHRSLSSINLK